MDMEVRPRPIIKMMPVVSSQIAALGHDQETNTLAIKFPDTAKGAPGSLYHYQNVTAELFADFIGAESIGSFFIKRIKNDKESYPFTRIE